MDDRPLTRERFYYAIAAVSAALALFRVISGDAGIAAALAVLALFLVGAGWYSRRNEQP